MPALGTQALFLPHCSEHLGLPSKSSPPPAAVGLAELAATPEGWAWSEGQCWPIRQGPFMPLHTFNLVNTALSLLGVQRGLGAGYF